jgi:Ca-activated chloride channel family protein
MILNITIIALVMSAGYELKADPAGDLVREGNRLYHEKKYNEAEVSYRKALELSPTEEASFNLGDALYKQGKFEESEKIFQTLSAQGADKTELADSYHNLGNSYLQSKKYKEGLEAFKNSVLNNPNDPDAKYNYEYARRLLQQQQEQKKKDDQKKDDKNKDQDKKDQKQDQGKKDQDKKDQSKKDDQKKQDQGKKDDQKKDGEKKDQQQQQDQGAKDQDKQEKGPKPQEQKISKEDAERMLKALQKEEQKLQ